MRRTYVWESVHCGEIDDDAEDDGEEIHGYFVVEDVFLSEHEGEGACEVNVVGPGKIPENDHEVKREIKQSFHFTIEVHKSKVHIV